MKRRDFVKNTTLTAIGVALMPLAALFNIGIVKT